MAKRRTYQQRMLEFDSLLETKFRWPQSGDRAFRTHEIPAGNTSLEQHPHARPLLMTDGYKLGGDEMVAAAERDRDASGSLIFPAIFCYRHFIELSLKNLVATYGEVLGIAPIWNTHDLAKLWSTYSQILEGYGTSDPDEADPVVEQIVAEFAKLDPASFSLRYPVDKKGEPIPLGTEELDLGALRDAMNALDAYFSGAHGYLESCNST